MNVWFFKELSRAFSESMCLLDIEGNILERNEAANHFLGEHTLHKGHLSSHLLLSGEEFAKLIRQTRRTNDPVKKIITLIDHKQQEIECRCNLILLRIENTQPSILFRWKEKNQTKTTFNILNSEIDKLQKKYTEVMDQRDNLKEHVRKRTLELEKTNEFLQRTEIELHRHHDNLQSLVDEKTKALSDAIEIAIFEKEKAERANKAKTEFLSNMSHELRTPLHAILSYSKMGIKKNTRISLEKSLEYFTQINTGGKRLLDLIGDLLDISKLESGKMEMAFEMNDIMNVIASCESELQGILSERKLTLKIEKTTEISHAEFDSTRITQVITNLLSNALKFSPREHTITIEVSEKKQPLNNKTQQVLQVKVSDYGIGIPPNELEGIFDQFVQSSTTKTGAGGTGLGLCISKSIIKFHHGEIWAENNEDQGCTFHFVIPVKQTL